MADVVSKQQTAALFLSTIVTRTRRHTELNKKNTDIPAGKPVLCQRTVQSFVQFFTQLNCTAMGPVLCKGPSAAIL
jgi:hypothetical protein